MHNTTYIYNINKLCSYNDKTANFVKTTQKIYPTEIPILNATLEYFIVILALTQFHLKYLK